MTKASDNLFPKVLLDMQTSDPTAPTDADWKLYSKANGVFARSSNAVVGPFGTGGAGDVATDAIWDAKGDLAVGTAANTAARLAVGTNWKYLIAASGEATGLAYVGFIGAKAYMAATQSINHNSETACTFDTEEFDTHAFHSTSVDTSRFTIPTGMDGKYRLIGVATFAANGTGQRTCYWKSGGSTYLRAMRETNVPTASFATQVIAETVVDLAAAAYVEFVVYQSSGGSLNIGHATDAWVQTMACIEFLGP